MDVFVFAVVEFVESIAGQQVAWLIPAFGIVSAIASLLDALIPDGRQPEWLGHLIKAAAINVGRASNSTDAQ